jgi:hypothetical protein
MQNYVRGRGSGDIGQFRSAQTSSHSNTNKAQLAAQAKVDVAATTLDHNDHMKPPLRELERGGGIPTTSSFRQQQERPAFSKDRYDTDAESLNTPQSRFSAINDRQGHHSQNGQNVGEAETGNEYGEDDDGHSDEHEDEGWADDREDDYEFDDLDQQILQNIDFENQPRPAQLELIQRMREDQFIAVSSYPSTTSGQPDFEKDTSDQNDRDFVFQPLTVQPKPNSNQPHSTPHQQQTRQRHVPTSSQPPTYSQTFQASNYNQAVQRSSLARKNQSSSRYNPTPHAHQYQPAPHHDAAFLGGQIRTKEPRGLDERAQQTAPTRIQNAPAEESERVKRPIQVPPTPQPAAEGTYVEQTAERIEDYEDDELFEMRYEDLKNETFDTKPHAEPHILSDDMRSKPLKDRLEYVQKSLDDSGQTKFLSSLPTNEWEDAGEWFLDQFKSLVGRAKRARQNKRKLAKEFEEEVGKRHDQVVKKRKTVDDALNQMQKKGTGLLPKSPTPGRTK